MTSHQKNRHEFLEVLQGEANPTLSVLEVDRLGKLILRHAVTHHRLAIMDCNGPEHLQNGYWWDRPEERKAAESEWYDWKERRQAQVENRLQELASDLAVRLMLGGDPRGCTVKLETPKTRRHNSWGGA